MNENSLKTGIKNEYPIKRKVIPFSSLLRFFFYFVYNAPPELSKFNGIYFAKYSPA